MSDDVLTELRGRVLYVTINRPERRNAMNAEVLHGIDAAVAQASGDTSIDALVLTGAGDQAFCAGGDLVAGNTFQFDYAQPMLDFANLLRRARAATVPLIARVDGACMAGGMGLLAMCDLAFASNKSLFALPEVKIGLFPMQVLTVLQHLIPRRVLTELCISGEPIDAATAKAIGLINDVGDDVDALLERQLARIAKASPTAVRRGLYAMKRVETMSFEESMAFTESQLGLAVLTEDAREGLASFGEKRKPVWPRK